MSIFHVDLLSDLRCGKVSDKAKAATRIIGGKSSGPGEWPWAVQFRVLNSFKFRFVPNVITLIASSEAKR